MKISVSNSNDATWKIKISKYAMDKTTSHGNVFRCFKGTGSYVAAYGDADGYIVLQPGTGAYGLQLSGEYVTS